MPHIPSNRKSPRYFCEFNGHLRVLCPEVTFEPKPFPVIVQDLSESGCRMLTRAVSRDFYKSLLKSIRPVKLELDLGDGRMLILRGKLVWIDFHEKTPTVLAITFNALEGNAQLQLQNLLEELSRSGAIMLAETQRPESMPAGDAAR